MDRRAIFKVAAAVPMLLLSAALARAETVCLLDGDCAAFDARLSLIASARCSIDAAYFAIEDDCAGLAVAQALIDASQRGVRVRLLVDGGNDSLDHSTRSALLRSGVDLREYHPLKWTKPHWAFHRLHDKLLVSDGERMIVGGRNISAAYFGMSEKDHFSDRDVLICGQTAQHAAAYFDDRWCSADVIAVCQQGFLRRWLPLSGPPNLFPFARHVVGNTPIGRLCDEIPLPKRPATTPWNQINGQSCCAWSTQCFEVAPESICFLHSSCGMSIPCADISSQLVALIHQARVSIVIEAPYLVVTEEFEHALAAACARGVQVHIITNSPQSTNQLLAQAGYESQKQMLLERGIHLWEYQGPDTLHSKCWIIDDCAVIGSYNLDSRSALYDTQTAIVIRDPAVVSTLLTSIVHRHQANSVQPTIAGDVFDPLGVQKPTPISRKALLQVLRPAVPLIKPHL